MRTRRGPDGPAPRPQVTGSSRAPANRQEGLLRLGRRTEKHSKPLPPPRTPATRNTSLPSMPCRARAAPRHGRPGRGADAPCIRSRAGTRRPAIRRRKLQPSAPPPAVGGALACNGSPPWAGGPGVVVEAAWGRLGRLGRLGGRRSDGRAARTSAPEALTASVSCSRSPEETKPTRERNVSRVRPSVGPRRQD